MSQHAFSVTPRRINKSLFASGLQCAKKLYLDVHEPDDVPAPSLRRQSLLEIGARLIELARTAFPKSETADPGDIDVAIEQTGRWLRERAQVPIFDAAFAADKLEARADIVIPDAQGALDVYEVKSGNKVKTRHIRDLAFQVHVIRRCGFEVGRAWILHLNPQYRHRGGPNYPVHELFKNVDVTTKVMRHVDRVADQVATFEAVLDDPMTRELPTGTWCHRPFTCGYLPRCREEGPEKPLLDLPDLTHEQESALHQEGIEELSQIETDWEDLSLVQRRAVRAVHDEGLVIEPFVGRELRDVEYPLLFVDTGSLLQVLPMFEGSRPWQHIPYRWHVAIADSADADLQVERFVTDARGDPRGDFLRTLAEAVEGGGTLMLYGSGLEQRLRDLLDDKPENKAEARAILNQARFDLRQLLRAGVYHPGFKGSFDLHHIHRSLIGGSGADALDIRNDDEAQVACQRLFVPRTRATTKEKLARQLDAYGERCARAIHEIYGALLKGT